MKKKLIFILCIVISLIFLYPMIWALISSLKSTPEYYQYPPSILPNKPMFSNYVDAWKSGPFLQYTINSITVTLLSVTGIVLSTSVIAYGFAKFEFRGKKILFALLLVTMMIPWDVKMIPQYYIFSVLGWINTYMPLVVPGFFGSSYYIFLTVQYLRTIPNDYAEAAHVDGANEFQIWSRIYLPMMKAPLILVAILNGLAAWNDYLGPLIFLNDNSKYTLSLGLASFNSVNDSDPISSLAMAVLIMIPPVIMFFLAQKQILGNAAGGVKG